MCYELIALVTITCVRLGVAGIAIYGAWRLMLKGADGWGWLIVVAIILAAFNCKYENIATCPKCGEVFKLDKVGHE